MQLACALIFEEITFVALSMEFEKFRFCVKLNAHECGFLWALLFNFFKSLNLLSSFKDSEIKAR